MLVMKLEKGGHNHELYLCLCVCDVFFNICKLLKHQFTCAKFMQ